jgi:hypothetical protein
MTDQEYTDLRHAEELAQADHIADPDNKEKFDRWYALADKRARSREERRREKYPVVQFERVPDEGLL